MFTPEFFNTLIVLNIVVGLSLAARRFYVDMTRQPKYLPKPTVAADAIQPQPPQEPTP